ncbi:MAG: RNA polymerase sigma-70 factor [Tannerella sp.]|jgi:RNA polymerase sigma-70 factor (ECF subfamily)|nr:RNA polymerase sigma-70 factor [Tannerella sp.]
MNNMTSFEQLYLSYYPKLVRFSKEYVLSEEDAENIVQDVFLIFWEQKEQLPYLRNIPSYLFKLTKNKSIDFLRHKMISAEKQKQLYELQMHELQYRLYAMEQFGENVLYEKELNAIIHQAIQSLPQKCREIFILSRFDELSQQEIADKYSISVSTVNNQITKALKILKEQLKDILKDYLYIFIFLGLL